MFLLRIGGKITVTVMWQSNIVDTECTLSIPIKVNKLYNIIPIKERNSVAMKIR